MKTNLKQIRKAAGWSNADDFADHIGMNRKTYRNYEQGVRNMGLDVASEICNGLGCSINDLVDVRYAVVEIPDDAGKFEEVPADDERELLSLYRRMVDDDKSTFLDMARALAIAGDAKKEDAERVEHRAVPDLK